MYKTIAYLLVAVFCPILAYCGEPVNPNLDPAARQVFDYLESICSQKMLAGYNVYVHTPDDYEQTGKHAAIWGRDIQWLGDVSSVIEHAQRFRYILTLHWHWFFNGESAWKDKREHPVDLEQLVTPGTNENRQLMDELAKTADILQQFEDAGIPILWRPLHEIDGGWFWWTDSQKPENTAQLWRVMFDYFTHERKLDNLIWVYSAGVGKKSTDYRKLFYAGPDYVDISGIDIYDVDYRNDIDQYWDYFNIMSEVSPGKMLTCGECDAIPDPDKTQKGQLPKWLYALPWWGAPSERRPVDWATFTMRHAFIVTLDELPPLGRGNIAPAVGILEPRDDGSAYFSMDAPHIEAYATDRDGSIQRVEFYAGDQSIGTDNTFPYQCVWENATSGCYDITAVAIDNSEAKTTSNTIRMTVGLVDAARGKKVVASSGNSAQNAVDGDYYTFWSSDNSDDEWIYVDLGEPLEINRVNLLWGWKIHAQDFSIDVAQHDPDRSENWGTVFEKKDHQYVTWKATDRINFKATLARYVRLHATKRAGNQTWAGYNLMAFEVLVRP